MRAKKGDDVNRKLHNREAAARSRTKSKSYLLGLEKEVERLTVENRLLKSQIAANQSEIVDTVPVSVDPGVLAGLVDIAPGFGEW
jgi:bZIP transcription factor